MNKQLVVAAEQIPGNFDMEQPVGFTNDLASDLFQSMYDQLTSPNAYVDADGVRRADWHNLRPVLAEAWWFSDDGMDCTFRIRRGVMSHDGHELTAADVKWGWDRAFALRDVGKWVARISSVQEETAVEVVDRYTVTYHLNAPNPLLPRAMAQCTPSVYDLAALSGIDTPDDPFKTREVAGRSAGFGPYRLGERSENEIQLIGHEQYWRGAPGISDVRIRKVASRQEALDSVLAGDSHLMTGVTHDEATRLRSAPNIEIVTLEGTPGLVLHLDIEDPAFADPLVRQAVACAIPYQEIIQTAYLGLAHRWRSYVQPQAPGYLDEWPYEEDLARARALLAASTFPDGFETRLVPRGGKEIEIAATLIQAALARLGIKMEIEIETARTRPNQTSKANPGPMMLRGGGAGGRGNRVYDPIYALYHDHGPGRMRLFRYTFENEAFYEALRSIPTAGTPEKWEAAAHTTQRILNEDAVTIPIAAYRSFVAHRSDLGGYLWYPDNRLSFYDLHWQ